MESDAFPALPGLEASPLNFIYACSVCCATFADAYEGHNETVQGLSDGINPKERLVTKLYLGNCCHVFCGEHIEGGGPPFHPAGQKPKAPCPVCVRDKGDSTIRELYSIRGFHGDEYDPAIPPVWFTAPPISLDGQSKEMEALRFQYLALIRYCQTSYRTRKPLVNALESTKQELATAQKRAADEHSKAVALQQENEKLRASAQQDMDALSAEVQRLQHLEQEINQFNADVEAFHRLKADMRDLDVFRHNKPIILQHLKLLPKVIEQNTKMQDRLASLGFAMALEPVPNYTHLTADDFNEIKSIAESYSEDDRRFQKSASSHTAGRSAYTSGNGAAVHPFVPSDRPLKRQRVDSPLPQEMHIDPPSSRDAMPPPSKPISRMHSVRGLIPTIRKKFSSSRSTAKGSRKHNGDVQMCDSGAWRDAVNQHIDDNRSSSGCYLRSGTPYMTGALPVEPVSQGSRLLMNVRAHANPSDFTFRASSPPKLDGRRGGHQPVQLPTGPSYLRLMDGLSRDNGVELGLKDPRESEVSHYNDAMRPIVRTPQNQYNPQGSSSQKRWNLGHAFLHQSPNGPSRSNDHPQRTSSYKTSVGHFNRAQYDPPVGFATAASSHLQQPVRQIENVVSHLFGRSHYDAPDPSQSRITETHTSSNHFGAFQSQRRPTSRMSVEWRERRNLNEPSFNESPTDLCKEPVSSNGLPRPFRRIISRNSQTHNQDSRGYFRRPDTQQPSLANNDYGYGPLHDSRRTFSQQRDAQSQSATPLTLYNQASPLRIGRPPSSILPIASSHFPLRNYTRWENLQRAGVRSSRQSHSKLRGNTSSPSSANLFSRVERRSVKR